MLWLIANVGVIQQRAERAHGGMVRMRAVHESYVLGVLVIFTTELFSVGDVFIKTQHPHNIHDISPGRGDYANF